MLDLLHTLPSNDIRRHRPLEGAWLRRSIIVPIDVTDSEEKRVELRAQQAAGERKWLPWKQVIKWKIASATFNDLGTVWTDDTEWTFDNPKP